MMIKTEFNGLENTVILINQKVLFHCQSDPSFMKVYGE